MRSSPVIFVLAFVKRAHAQELTPNHAGNAKSLMDKLANRFVDRLHDHVDTLVKKVFDSNLLHQADMDNITLFTLRAPLLSTSGSSRSPWAGHRQQIPDRRMLQVLRRIQSSSCTGDLLRSGHRGVLVRGDRDDAAWERLQRLQQGNAGGQPAGRPAGGAWSPQMPTGSSGGFNQMGAKLCTWFQYLLAARMICSFLRGITFLAPVVGIVAMLTEPYLSIFRAVIPSLGMFDFSFMIAFWVVSLVRQKIFKHPW